jgi:hypothetical protein
MQTKYVDLDWVQNNLLNRNHVVVAVWEKRLYVYGRTVSGRELLAVRPVPQYCGAEGVQEIGGEEDEGGPLHDLVNELVGEDFIYPDAPGTWVAAVNLGMSEVFRASLGWDALPTEVPTFRGMIPEAWDDLRDLMFPETYSPFVGLRVWEILGYASYEACQKWWAEMPIMWKAEVGWILKSKFALLADVSQLCGYRLFE